MSELRAHMLRDMTVRGFSPETHEAYIRQVVGLARHYHRSPDLLSADEVQAYLAHLFQARKRSWSTCAQAAHAFRFFYHVTLGREKTAFHVPAPKQPQKRAGPESVFLVSILSQVGLDAQRDVTWLEHRGLAEATQAFGAGTADAILAFPPHSQELHARKIGRSLLNSALDRPWSQYFCCVVAGHRDFIRRHPVATKRAVRAILKAADLCALQPERTARKLIDGGFAERNDYAVDLMKQLPYGKWREYDPTDTVRFYALRLHEAGVIKSSPQKILAQGTDWRFLNELKKELKG